jgi:hypothetical protein
MPGIQNFYGINEKREKTSFVQAAIRGMKSALRSSAGRGVPQNARIYRAQPALPVGI